MPITHAASRVKLETCHPDLQRVVYAASDRMPLIVMCGHRGKNEQNEAFLSGKSKLTWPHSKHNQVPSLACDLAPLDDRGMLDWNRLDLFRELGAVMQQEAKRLGIEITWGGTWRSFPDLPHFELRLEKQNPDL